MIIVEDLQIWLLTSQFFRSLWMDFETEVELEGITLYRFRPAADVFAMDNPNNYCYCPEFHECATKMEDLDEWNRAGCVELCKDGMLKVGFRFQTIEFKSSSSNLAIQRQSYKLEYGLATTRLCENNLL